MVAGLGVPIFRLFTVTLIRMPQSDQGPQFYQTISAFRKIPKAEKYLCSSFVVVFCISVVSLRLTPHDTLSFSDPGSVEPPEAD